MARCDTRESRNGDYSENDVTQSRSRHEATNASSASRPNNRNKGNTKAVILRRGARPPRPRTKKTKARTTITGNAQRAQIPTHSNSMLSNSEKMHTTQPRRKKTGPRLSTACQQLRMQGHRSTDGRFEPRLDKNNLFRKSFYSFFFGHTWVHSHGQSTPLRQDSIARAFATPGVNDTSHAYTRVRPNQGFGLRVHFLSPTSLPTWPPDVATLLARGNCMPASRERRSQTRSPGRI